MRKTIEVHSDVVDRLVIESLTEHIGYTKDFIQDLTHKKNNGGLKPYEQEDLDDTIKQLEHLTAVADYFGANLDG
jgi:hypothetical protein